MTINNCTISENHSNNNDSGSYYGGGIYLRGEETLSVRNSILANNYRGSGTVTGDDYYYYEYDDGDIAEIPTLNDNGYNVVEYQSGNNSGNNKTFTATTDILYNTKADGTTGYSHWNQNNADIDGSLNLSDTLADNGGPTETLALASDSFAAASAYTGIPPAGNWNSSPQIDGVYTDQRGVERTAGNNTSIGAYSENYASPPTHVALTGPATVLKNGLGAFTLTALNAGDQPANVTENTTFSLSSSSLGDTFYSDAAGTASITSATISNGSSAVTFYARDNTFGTPTLTATRTGGMDLGSDTLQIRVSGNNALSFDGSNDYVDCGTINLSGSALTFEAWVRPVAFQSASPYISSIMGEESGTNVALLRFGDAGLAKEKPQFILYAGGETKLDGNTALSTGIWQHLAATYDGSNMRIYLNGIEDASKEQTGSFTANAAFWIGAVSLGRYLNGQMDDIRVWNVARSADEIQANMHRELQGNETGLVAYYKLDTGAGTTAADSSGNGNSGTLTNGPAWQTSGAMSGPGNALDFDGIDDYVATASAPNLNMSGSSFTLELWVKSAAELVFSGEKTWIEYAGAWTSGNYLLSTTSDHDILFTFLGTSSDHLHVDVDWTDGLWHHVAAVLDTSTQKKTVYVNGVLKGQNDETNTPGNVNHPLYIGARTGPAQCSAVTMDEIRIWKRALSAQEIRGNMCTSLQGDEPGLTAYFRMDQQADAGQGTLYDQTPNGYDGTLYNMTPAEDWVASAAFNTWIGSNSTAWATAANWSRGSVPATDSPYDNVGLPDYSNTTGYPEGNDPAISGDPTVNHLALAAGAGATLSSGLTVNGNLVVEADLDLNGQTITLGPSGYLLEDAGRLYGETGSITTTRTFGAGDLSTAQNIAGLGAELTTDADMGSTEITRGHSAVSGESGLPKSVERYYEITPTTNSGLNATLKFYYNEAELNSIPEGDLALFRWNGSKWQCDATNQSRDTDSNWVQQTGIDAFSTWTLGDEDDPTLVDLVSFIAKGLDDTVRLEWETASEIDTAGFHLWRGKRKDGDYARITDVLIPAEGGSVWGAAYSYEDWDGSPGTTYFYQLQDIDTAGKSNFHGPASAWAGVADIQAGNSDKPKTATIDQAVSVKLAIQAGDYGGTPVEYWVAADTPFGWYSYGAQGWKPGIAPAAVGPLNDVAPLEVVNFPLPPGWYTFYLAVDDQVNGTPDLTWIDSVEVEVK